MAKIEAGARHAAKDCQVRESHCAMPASLSASPDSFTSAALDQSVHCSTEQSQKAAAPALHLFKKSDRPCAAQTPCGAGCRGLRWPLASCAWSRRANKLGSRPAVRAQ